MKESKKETRRENQRETRREMGVGGRKKSKD